MLSMLLNQAGASLRDSTKSVLSPKSLFRIPTRMLKDESDRSYSIKNCSEIRREIEELRHRSRVFDDFVKRLTNKNYKSKLKDKGNREKKKSLLRSNNFSNSSMRKSIEKLSPK